MKALIFIFLSITMISCNKLKCDYYDPTYANDARIHLVLKDAVTGDLLIPKYAKTDISITSENNENKDLIVEIDENASGVKLKNIIPYSDEENKEYCRRIYISYKNDKDTIDYCYKIVPTECGGSNLQNFTLKYNGKSIGNEAEVWDDGRYTIIK